MNPTRFDIRIEPQDPIAACEALARRTGISKSQIKQAMIKGAVWLTRAKTDQRRIRRATFTVRPGDRLLLYYDPTVLMLTPPEAHCLADYRRYSIWFKPAGLMAEGTRFGDHCCLPRQVELHFKLKRDVFLVHRLDREAAGVMMVAHDRKAAALLSKLFLNRAIEKRYRIRVRGDLEKGQRTGRIEHALDGKPAITDFTALRYEPGKDQTLVDVRIHTGRLHQIRRHFEMIGHPVMGDPRYGKNNKNKDGLQLTAYFLQFDCPFGNGCIEIEIDSETFNSRATSKE